MEQDRGNRIVWTAYRQAAKRRCIRIAGVFLALVVFVVATHAAALPAYAETAKTYCGKEAHTHTDACYTRVCICALAAVQPTPTPEEPAAEANGQTMLDPGHRHTDACYEQTLALVCEREEIEGEHKHADECYAAETHLICMEDEREPVYETPAPAHTHTDACYRMELTCDKEEHTHEEECYSNFADVETRSYWESTIPFDRLTGVWSDDLVLVAESQFGAGESETNFKFDGERRKGFTRFGAWYGNSHGDWCAMFVAFCLHYAGIPESAVPRAGGVLRYLELAKEYGLFRAVRDGYVPNKGDIIFFDTDRNGTCDHVGIVKEMQCNAKGKPVQLIAVEGNRAKYVKAFTYDHGDPRLYGYIALPQNPALIAETPLPRPTDTSTPQPTKTPAPTATAAPTATPEPPPTATATPEVRTLELPTLVYQPEDFDLWLNDSSAADVNTAPAGRSVPAVQLFTIPGKLQIGDTFAVTLMNEIYTFEVDEIRIMAPQDAPGLEFSPDMERCTLSIGAGESGGQQYMVYGVRVAPKLSLPSVAEDILSPDAGRIRPLAIAPFLAVPMLLLLLAGALIRRRIWG